MRTVNPTRQLGDWLPGSLFVFLCIRGECEGRGLRLCQRGKRSCEAHSFCLPPSPPSPSLACPTEGLLGPRGTHSTQARAPPCPWQTPARPGPRQVSLCSRHREAEGPCAQGPRAPAVAVGSLRRETPVPAKPVVCSVGDIKTQTKPNGSKSRLRARPDTWRFLRPSLAQPLPPQAEPAAVLLPRLLLLARWARASHSARSRLSRPAPPGTPPPSPGPRVCARPARSWATVLAPAAWPGLGRSV